MCADVVVIAAAEIRDVCHEILVVIGADTHRRNGDVVFADSFSFSRNLVRIRYADVRQSVGKQDDAVDVRLVEVFADFFETLLKSACKICGSAWRKLVDHSADLFFVFDR